MSADPWLYPLRAGETLADSRWVEWHIHRFLGSRFTSLVLAAGRRGDGFTAVLLWSEAFRQDPAGTLPDDDLELCRLAQFGADREAWLAARPLALHGWSPVLVEDDAAGGDPQGGRLGHRLIAEVAVRMARRRDGRKAGHDAQRLALARSRIKAKLTELRRPRMAENTVLLTEIAQWLEQHNLFITAENVAAALESLHGIARVVTLQGGADSR